MNFLAVAVGGAVGSVLRYLGVLFTIRIVGALPYWATLSVNLIGCFIMGMFSLLVLARAELPDSVKLALTTGLLGGFTTFSSFSFDAGRLINDGVYGLAAFYIGASVLGGLAAFFVGQHIAHQIDGQF